MNPDPGAHWGPRRWQLLLEQRYLVSKKLGSRGTALSTPRLHASTATLTPTQDALGGGDRSEERDCALEGSRSSQVPAEGGADYPAIDLGPRMCLWEQGAMHSQVMGCSRTAPRLLWLAQHKGPA